MKIKYWVPILLIVFIFSFIACATSKTATETIKTKPAITETTTSGTTINYKIAFMSERDGNREIYIMNTDRPEQVIRLTNNPAYDWQASFSPDGSKIVFNSTCDRNAEIYIMNADGSEQLRLTNNPANDQGPSFSPIP